jgi:hypothetical protein
MSSAPSPKNALHFLGGARYGQAAPFCYDLAFNARVLS